MFLASLLQVVYKTLKLEDIFRDILLIAVASTTGSAALFGDIMQPSGGTGTTNGSKDGAKVLTGDLDSSLANLASNLTFGPSGNK